MNKIEHLCQGKDLTLSEAMNCFQAILQGELSEIEMSALLIALKSKGESTSEILGAVKTMRQHAFPFPELETLKTTHRIIDCVGTGGDNQQSLNISTPSAIMAAALGLTVAKHGNRAVSSLCGTADLLEGVGINITMAPSIARETLIKTGFTFLYAPLYHPAMQTIKTVRSHLKTRTIFNLIGPLLNPTSPDTLLIGVYHPSLTARFAQVLQSQGTHRALIVHGQGLDEIALHGPTIGTLLTNGELYPFSLTPEEVGLPRFSLSSLRGKDLQFNRQHFLDLLQGNGTQAYQCAVALNTGVLLWLAESTSSIQEGVEQTLQALKTDIGYQCLQQIKEASHVKRND